MGNQVVVEVLTGMSLVAGCLVSAAERPVEIEGKPTALMNPEWLVAGQFIHDAVGTLTEQSFG